VGDTSKDSIYSSVSESKMENIPLKLVMIEKLVGEIVYLTYEVLK
jgi:hypothetical protein